MRLTCGLRSRAGIGWVVLLMACCLAGMCGRAWAVGATENVVVVVVDGARYTETFGDPTHKYISHMWYLLRPQGAIHTGMYNRGQTDTLGGHATLLTGNHCWIDWPEEGLSRPTTPTLFEYFRATTGAEESSTWLVANHLILLAGMMHSEHPNYGEAYTASGYLGPGSDYKLWQDVSAIMDEHQPRLMLLNLHATDALGHQGLWREYTRRLTVADRVVYEIWRKIQRHPFYAGRTTLIVTNDHGRHTNNFLHHGDWCEGCQHVMLLALGPDVRRGQVAGSPERGLHDIGATVGWLLDLPMPYGIDGEVMTELFRPELEVPPEQKAVIEGLEVTAATADSEGQPSTVFSPGETVSVSATIRNLQDSQVRIYQGEVQTQRACVGESYRETPVDLAAGGTTTQAFAVPIPDGTSAGDWPVTVEFRGLDQDGTIVRGMTTLVITVESGA